MASARSFYLAPAEFKRKPCEPAGHMLSGLRDGRGIVSQRTMPTIDFEQRGACVGGLRGRWQEFNRYFKLPQTSEDPLRQVLDRGRYYARRHPSRGDQRLRPTLVSPFTAWLRRWTSARATDISIAYVSSRNASAEMILLCQSPKPT